LKLFCTQFNLIFHKAGLISWLHMTVCWSLNNLVCNVTWHFNYLTFSDILVFLICNLYFINKKILNNYLLKSDDHRCLIFLAKMILFLGLELKYIDYLYHYHNNNNSNNRRGSSISTSKTLLMGERKAKGRFH